MTKRHVLRILLLPQPSQEVSCPPRNTQAMHLSPFKHNVSYSTHYNLLLQSQGSPGSHRTAELGQQSVNATIYIWTPRLQNYLLLFYGCSKVIRHVHEWFVLIYTQRWELRLKKGFWENSHYLFFRKSSGPGLTSLNFHTLPDRRPE